MFSTEVLSAHREIVYFDETHETAFNLHEGSWEMSGQSILCVVLNSSRDALSFLFC